MYKKKTKLCFLLPFLLLLLPVFIACEISTTSERCGNGVCGGSETCSSCPSDCGPCAVCGDGRCIGGETCSSCPRDCGECSGCGDGTCSTGENCSNCPQDCGVCPSCGDGNCQSGETCSTCPQDCGSCHATASIAFGWKILGSTPTASVCSSVGGKWVQLWLDNDGNGTTDKYYEFECSQGHGVTPEDFHEGDNIRYAFALLAESGSVITQSDTWYTETLQAGINDLGTVDFTVTPQHNASVSYAWYIHYVLADDSLCSLFGGKTVQMWLDDNNDGTADRSFDADCKDGYGSTGFVFDSGTTIKYAFALLNSAGTVISQSMAWETKTLSAGNNDLGTVNFIVGDYGPLSVDLQWANSTAGTSFGGCNFPEPAVSIMGYLLCWGELQGGTCPAGNIYDVVDIDTAPVACEENLSWDILDFGNYTLVIDGEDASHRTLWGAECQGLIVDSVEPDSNNFLCRVLMTVSP